MYPTVSYHHSPWLAQHQVKQDKPSGAMAKRGQGARGVFYTAQQCRLNADGDASLLQQVRSNVLVGFNIL